MLDRTLSVLHNPKGLSACLPSFLPFFLPSMQTYFIEFQGKERMRNKHLGVWSGTFHTNSQPRKVTLSKTLVMLEQEMAWNSGKYNMNFGVRFLWLGAQGGYVPELLWDSVSLFVKWVNICDLVKVWQSNDTSKGNELSTWSIRALSEEKLIL